jgi:23S rRNA (pseudouridine1915-N3)-methyltransferase
MQQLITRLDLLVVGSASREYAPAIADYERRIGARVKYSARELKGVPLKDGTQRSSDLEGERIISVLDAMNPSAIWVFDSRGDQLTSEEFARELAAEPRPCLVLGGAAGLSDEVTRRASRRISLGRQTMPHQLARLVVVEQIYRAFTIMRGEPYHW